jgi:hypothetical protein
LNALRLRESGHFFVKVASLKEICSSLLKIAREPYAQSTVTVSPGLRSSAFAVCGGLDSASGLTNRPSDHNDDGPVHVRPRPRSGIARR